MILINIYVLSSECFLADFYFTDIPNILGILFDSAVTTEFSCPQSIQNRHLGPLGFVLIGLVYLLLSGNVRLEISTEQIPIIIVGNSTYQLH